MGSFLSVAKGSDEPPVFLEIHYKGSPNASDPPLVFVGKGITFDRFVLTLCVSYLGNCLCALVLLGVCLRSMTLDQILHITVNVLSCHL